MMEKLYERYYGFLWKNFIDTPVCECIKFDGYKWKGKKQNNICSKNGNKLRVSFNNEPDNSNISLIFNEFIAVIP